MGHYRCEMVCEVCDRAPCRCPPKPDPSRSEWLVDDDLTVMTVGDFDEKYKTVPGQWGPNPGYPMLRRIDMKQFKTKEEAEAYITTILEDRIERLMNRIAHDKVLLIATRAELDRRKS